MNLAHWLERAARTHPNLPAIALGDRIVADYGALARRSAAVSCGLAKMGLKPGDRVAIAAHNCPEYLEALFAAWWGGFVAVPINAKLHLAEIAWILEHCIARAVLASPDLAGALAVYEPDTVIDTIALGSPAYRRLAAAQAGPLVERAPDDLAWLFYTSGTTGRPKGAMLTHRNLMAMSLAYLADVDPAAPCDSLIHAAPMSHGSGLYSMAHVSAWR